MHYLLSGHPFACLADFVLPRACAVCGRYLRRFERHICTCCLADLPLTFNWLLPHNEMADRFNEKIQHTLCRDGTAPTDAHTPYSFAVSLFFFNSEASYRRIPYGIKYKGDVPLGLFFGNMLGQAIGKSPVMKDINIILPVPLHWTRRWKRGYNQAEIIAKGISMALDAEVRTDILYRKHRTRTQTRLSVEEKAANVNAAFGIRKRIPPEARHVLIVDDVFTTGATLHSCWQAVANESRGIRISVAALAMVSN